MVRPAVLKLTVTTKMRLSIITINKNNKAGLARTIDSVVGQTAREFEHVVIDGGSDDGSMDVIDAARAHLHDSVSEPDAGIYQAMNKGIRRVRGQHLLFLNSGDWLVDPRVVEDLLPELQGDDIVSGDLDFCENGRWLRLHSQDTLTPGFFTESNLYHQATFIPRVLFDRHGFYDERFRIAGDFEFFIRAILRGGAGYRHVRRTIARFIGDGLSNRPEMRGEVLAEKERAWRSNFSDVVVDDFRRHAALRRSRELRWGRRLFKYAPFAGWILK